MLVVTLPLSAASDPLAFALRAKQTGAQVLEIRGDLTPDVATFVSPLPLLVSPRGTGAALIERLEPAMVDLEEQENLNLPKNVTTIRSFHDYTGTPIDLGEIANRLLALQPNILKIAVTISSYADLSRLLALQDQLPQKQKRVLLGMGPMAHLTRLLSPTRNALTYTFFKGTEPAAPGQVGIEAYADLLQVRTPALYGILGGEQVSQSLSPLIHRTLFKRHTVDALYAAFPCTDLEDAWTQLTALGVRGFSVTAPWKRDIVQKMDRLHPLAEELGAVNTAVLKGGKWTGHNTDVTGLLEAYDFSDKGVAIAGSGGVVPSVIAAARHAGARTITVYARNPDAAAELGDRFEVDAGDLEHLRAASPDLLVWAASGDPEVAIPPARPGAVAVDLRYGRQTGFLQEAGAMGYELQDGMSMLLHQALAQFGLFTGIEPTDADLRALVSLLPSSHGR